MTTDAQYYEVIVTIRRTKRNKEHKMENSKMLFNWKIISENAVILT